MAAVISIQTEVQSEPLNIN